MVSDEIVKLLSAGKGVRVSGCDAAHECAARVGCRSSERQPQAPGVDYCPRCAGATPAKVRKSTILKLPDCPPKRSGSVGRQVGCTRRYELRLSCISPISTSPTIRPPTGPSALPPVA